MSRQYLPQSSNSAPSGTRSAEGRAERHPGHRRYGSYAAYGPRADRTGSTQTEVIEDFDDIEDFEDFEDFDDDVEYYEDQIDRRWIWVAGVAGAILLVAVICTVVILGGGDSGSVSKTVSPPAETTGQAPTTSTAPPVATSRAPLPPAPGPLTPETVTTVTPEPTASAAPAPTPTPALAPTVAAPDPRTVTYQVTGTRQLIDLVTVIYTDQQGALQTDLNVALPWTKTVVLDPGVDLTSVTATSVLGQLNCSITDAGGATIAAQATNSMITTCTK